MQLQKSSHYSHERGKWPPLLPQSRIEPALKIIKTRLSSLSNGKHLETADLLNQQWSQKDGGKRVWEYLKDIQLRSQNSREKTPTFIAEIEGKIVGVIFPIRTHTTASTWDELTGGGSWSTDTFNGHLLYCPQIVVCSGAQAKGVARALIVDGVLPYARVLWNEGKISYFAAFSRPARYGMYQDLIDIAKYLKTSIGKEQEGLTAQMEAYGNYIRGKGLEISEENKFPVSLRKFLKDTGRRHIDLTIGMHLSFGAEISRIIPNGCPKDRSAGGYIIEMDYTHQLKNRKLH